MLTAPGPAATRFVKKAGMTFDDIDLFEVNEAFASVVLKFLRDTGVDWDRVNVNGGAIALGHPIGATGGMLIGTLLDELERQDKTTGLVIHVHGRRHGDRDDHRARLTQIANTTRSNEASFVSRASIVRAIQNDRR